MSADSAAAQPATPDSLIEQCLAGDQIAWEQIVRQNWRKVFNVAYKFVGKHDEAEDLTQDIFLKIFKALKTSDRLGLPEGTVKSRINRGRIELAHQLRRLQENQPVKSRKRGAVRPGIKQ